MALFSRRGLGWAVLASELGHVFCCILPTFFSLFSFAANIGLIGGAPGFLAVVHEIIHRYELPVILFSGFMVGVGWLVYWGSRRLRVCGDAMCAKGARHNRLILVIATGLFTVNVFIFAVVHKNVFGLPFFMEASPSHEEHEIP